MLGDFGDFNVIEMKESDDWMIKIIYFDERELLVRREIETKASKTPKPKSPKCYPKRTKVNSCVLHFVWTLKDWDFLRLQTMRKEAKNK